MAERLHVLCMSPDPTTAAGVAAMFASLPEFTVASRTAGYEEGARDPRMPDLAIVLLEEDPTDGIAAVAGVRRGARAAYVVAVSPEDDPETIVKAMRAGADQHLSLPLSQPDLLKICIKIAEARRGSAPKEARGGALWAVYSPKGGVGVTTLAVNLAVALRAAGREVALVDLDVYAADVAVFLNLKPAYTLRDVAANLQRVDSAYLHGTMIRLPSGLHVLAAPATDADAPPLELSAEETTVILERVSGMHEVTLVDTAGIPSEATRAALAAADRVLLVTDLTVPALRACVRSIDWLRSLGVDLGSALEVVVNGYANRSAEISPAEASRTLGVPLPVLLPRDNAAVAAANAGRPLAEVGEGSPLERAIAALATRGSAPADKDRRRPGLLRLFSGAART